MRPRSIAESFDPRRNALNFLRLLLASAVIVSHAIALGGFGDERIVGNATLGDVAVDGFFGISGFLIARSATTTPSVARLLWKRFLRIYPGMWVCLIVVAFVIAPIGWAHEHPGVPLSGYLHSGGGPFAYLAGSFSAVAFLAIPRHVVLAPLTAIAGSPSSVPLPGSWSGQLWTIQWEIVCYGLLAAFAATRLIRRREAVLILGAAVWLLALVNYRHPGAVPGFWLAPLRLVPDFMAGAALYLYADRVPDSKRLLALAGAIFAVGLLLPNPDSADILCGPPIAYIAIWLGVRLPLTRLGRRTDLSYGVYIYGFPVQQLLAVYGVQHWGYAPYLALAITYVLALLSWRGVEAPAMRLRERRPLGSRRRTSPATSRALPEPAPVRDQGHGSVPIHW